MCRSLTHEIRRIVLPDTFRSATPCSPTSLETAQKTPHPPPCHKETGTGAGRRCSQRTLAKRRRGRRPCWRAPAPSRWRPRRLKAPALWWRQLSSVSAPYWCPFSSGVGGGGAGLIQNGFCDSRRTRKSDQENIIPLEEESAFPSLDSRSLSFLIASELSKCRRRAGSKNQSWDAKNIVCTIFIV